MLGKDIDQPLDFVFVRLDLFNGYLAIIGSLLFLTAPSLVMSHNFRWIYHRIDTAISAISARFSFQGCRRVRCHVARSELGGYSTILVFHFHMVRFTHVELLVHHITVAATSWLGFARGLVDDLKLHLGVILR